MSPEYASHPPGDHTYVSPLVVGVHMGFQGSTSGPYAVPQPHGPHHGYAPHPQLPAITASPHAQPRPRPTVQPVHGVNVRLLANPYVAGAPIHSAPIHGG